MAGLSRATDPRAVRVRVAAGTGTGEEAAIEVSPAPEPLHMTNPSVGAGPLGGLAIAPGADEPPTVSAQRQPIVDGRATQAILRSLGRGRHRLEEASTSTLVVLGPDAPTQGGVSSREVLVGGFRFTVEVESERIAALRERATSAGGTSVHAGPLQVKAIIPGKVVAVSVSEGDAVVAGQQLLVVEAMKMQNELRAPRDGTIDHVGVLAGVNIEIGDLLVVIS